MKRTRSTEIERFIVKTVLEAPGKVTQLTAAAFGISRQAAHRHVQRLVEEKVLAAQGVTRNRIYTLLPLVSVTETFPLKTAPSEDQVWRNYVSEHLSDIPENVRDICQYGFTEMFNNVLDHSEGTTATIKAEVTAATIDMMVRDDGVGIFRKLCRDLVLEDEREALFELTKGKITTDPKHHSGEGIFFSSRMFDFFGILSGRLGFLHENRDVPEGDYLVEAKAEDLLGTAIDMKISVTSKRTLKEVFDHFTVDEDDYGFARTGVVVHLMRRGNENLVSRSQAKRLLSGVERFREVELNFEGVESIGQAFADEIFRVFVNNHPETILVPFHTNDEVAKMIRRAKASS
jgi:anti-sigma regulatory factor (Ser/Thr protein kinase)